MQSYRGKNAKASRMVCYDGKNTHLGVRTPWVQTPAEALGASVRLWARSFANSLAEAPSLPVSDAA